MKEIGRGEGGKEGNRKEGRVGGSKGNRKEGRKRRRK